MTHDPYDTENRPVGSPTEDPYVRRTPGPGYGGSGIAFIIFGVVAVLLIGFAMFGGYSDTDTVSTTPQTTTEQQAPQAQPEQPATTPETMAPSTNNSGSTTNQQ
jgi:predicted metalloprotease